MKNATKYEKKVRKLLASIDKSPREPPDEVDPFEILVVSVLQADASDKQVEKARAVLQEEFVDLNELRVAPTREIADCLGSSFPGARTKAHEITVALNGVFARRNTLSFEHVEKMTKRDLRRHLAELGLRSYAAACMMLRVFEGHAVPVDQSLADCLEIAKCIEPGSAIEDVQSFLERVILQKHALAAHEFFRQFVAESARPLARKRKADAEARAKAEAKAKKAEEEARAKRRSQRAAEARKARAKKARKRARKPSASKKAGEAKTPKKRSARRPAKRSAKKTGK